MGSGTEPDEREDQQLMARIQTGDRSAFEALYRRYAHPIMNFYYQMCFDRTAAEDFLQETFLRVWRARHTYRPIGKVSTWLFQISKNYWFNEREKRKLRPFHSASGGEDAQARWAHVADERGDADPGAVASGAETRALVERAVAELSEKLRVVFVLARYRGLPYAQIADIVGIPVGTVKSRMALAEKTLRARLEAELGGEGA